MSPVEFELAAWVAGLDMADLPPRVRVRVEDLFLDAVASAFAGRSQPLLELVDEPARAFGGDGTATVIGGAPAAPSTAVFLNAYAVTSATICDVYRPALCHVTPVSLPPLLALAESRDASWGELLVGYAAALEVTVRLARGLVYDETRSRGWHSPGVVGPVGAAAGAARIMGLDGEATNSALAHGAAQAAGTFAGLGTEAVKFNQARAAVAGLLAGLMAGAGLRAAERWFTHTDGGMVAAYSNGGAPALVLAGLGTDWELERISLRPWPAASSVQSLIDACLELRRDESLDPFSIRAVEIELAPEAFTVSGPRGWDDPLSAQQSARWVAATVLTGGDWWLEHFGLDRIGDPGVGTFAAERVTVRAAEDLQLSALRLRVTLSGGNVLEVARSDAPGDPSRPLTRSDVEAKLRRAGSGYEAAEPLVEAAGLRDDDAPAGAVIGLLAGAGRGVVA